jgi:cytosine/adenosine deaminase-related metal-dependent hydrolase
MITYRADWVLPIIDEPIRRGVVGVVGDRIASVGTDASGEIVDLGRCVILPSLVNAHTHLELSHLHGRIPPGENFVQWVSGVIAARRDFPDIADPRIIDAAQRAIVDLEASGTGLVGDVSNSLVTVPLLRASRLRAQVFYEQLGFNASDPEARVREARERLRTLDGGPDVRIALAPHAPYSVSPGLFAAIRADLDANQPAVSTVHLGESPDEVEFLKRGTGRFRELLERIGVWTDAWRPPGVSPVAYLSDLGFLDRSVLAVHGVQFEGEDLSTLATLGMTIVSCPRSNAYVGVGSPPLEAFYAMDVDVAFGTDSLASAPDLSVFAELGEARRLAPRVPARRLLESATRIGARALGFGNELGTIESGKRASLIAVRVPEAVTDVEEYLVSGISPEAISCVDPDRGKGEGGWGTDR